MRTLVTLLFWAIMTPLNALWGFPLTLITGNINPLYWTALWIARTGIRIAGVRWTTVGMERLDFSRNYIFMSNHVSNLDPPVLIPILPQRVTVLVKKELFRVPILGTAMKMADLIQIDRTNRESAVAGVHEAERVVREKHLSIVIYPEGTRSPDGRLLPFKKGAFYLAMDTGLPIVPVTMLGTERLQPKGQKLITPGETTIIFHDPIDTREFTDRDALMEAVREKIASALPAELQ